MNAFALLLLSAVIAHSFMSPAYINVLPEKRFWKEKIVSSIAVEAPCAGNEGSDSRFDEHWFNVERAHILYFMNKLKCKHVLGVLRFYQSSKIYPTVGRCKYPFRKDPDIVQSWNSALKSFEMGAVRDFRQNMPYVSAVYANYRADKLRNNETFETIGKLVLELHEDKTIEKAVCHSNNNIVHIPSGLLSEFQVRLSVHQVKIMYFNVVNFCKIRCIGPTRCSDVRRTFHSFSEN